MALEVKPAADAASPSTRRGRAREAAADGPRELVVQDRDVRRRRQAEREGGHRAGAASSIATELLLYRYNLEETCTGKS